MGPSGQKEMMVTDMHTETLISFVLEATPGFVIKPWNSAPVNTVDLTDT